VEVWGASLMSAFVPSREWPDAIVSILPGGVSSFDIKKLQGKIEGVERIHELAPLQVAFHPLEEMPSRGGFETGGKGPRRQYRNALLLGSDWIPDFRFVAGDRESAVSAVKSGDNCIITEMMARARGLKIGDDVKLDAGRGLVVSLKVAGIVDLNWHMVTSRGLLRGLNRMPVNTDGPVFVSFDTVEACDARPAAMVKMTHLWLDYEPEFLSRHGVFPAGRIVEKRIADALGSTASGTGSSTVRHHSRDEIADGTLAHGVDIIGSMAKVPFIFIAVAALGFIAMLVAAADSRRNEFRTLYAVGATRLQIAFRLTLEALYTALAGVAAGLPAGALVGWLFTSVTRAAMANWGLPPSFVLPVGVGAQGAVGAVVFALAVSVPTALALVRRRG
jgi:putative ABC transport system permease protein